MGAIGRLGYDCLQPFASHRFCRCGSTYIYGKLFFIAAAFAGYPGVECQAIYGFCFEIEQRRYQPIVALCAVVRPGIFHALWRPAAVELPFVVIVVGIDDGIEVQRR